MQLTSAVGVRPYRFALFSAAALGVLATLSMGQLAGRAREAAWRQLVTGSVFLPDGSPAAGAVVATSAGGETQSGADGSFALEVEQPLDADSLVVTAILEAGSGSLVASVRLVPGAAAMPVGRLMLQSPDGCLPRWIPNLGEPPGTNRTVRALASFDDGTGPALYVGGTFTLAGPVSANRIAKWDGSHWTSLGNGLEYFGAFDPEVHALAGFDDGSGPALYAGGLFNDASGVSANQIAKWDGTSWSSVGGGVTGGIPIGVHALAVFDDGGGPALYAGGGFTGIGGVSANQIAKWDGTSWSSLGSGTGNQVTALAVFDDGNGPALYAGGSFTTAGGAAANRVAKWNGTSWSALGSGVNSAVYALTIYDDGSGPALIAGGDFTTADGAAANRVAKWNGTSWSALGTGIVGGSSPVRALSVFDGGSGPELYAGGTLTSAGGVTADRIAKWDGASWSAVDDGVDSTVYALTVHDDGSGPVLYTGGTFDLAGSLSAYRIARWDGASWSAFDRGLDQRPSVLEVLDDGTGPALYAGGLFQTAGGVQALHLAKHDGSGWSAFGAFDGAGVADVRALAAFDDGSGQALYAAGAFTSVGGVPANRIAKWDGSSWSALGSGTNTSGINALAVFDDGSGPALYAGGSFTIAGGLAANRIARWDGASWSTLGSGLDSFMLALTVFDDGGGPALYAGGTFTTAGGVAANYIAKWDGASWSALGSGTNGVVNSLRVFDDGSGPGLYVGGIFTSAGGAAANHVAKWDGTGWSALGSGTGDVVRTFEVFDDGAGPALYAGGDFETAGGIVARGIARWDGSVWSPLGRMSGNTFALAGFDDGRGPLLYVGGTFRTSPAGDSYLARWGCRSKTTVKKHKL